MILPKGATVAVVDGEKLVMFKNTGEHEPQLSALPPPAIDAKGAGSTGHQSSAANPDNSTQAEDGYAAGVAEMLNAQALSGAFDHLLVIAAPKTLGELRKHWGKPLQAKLVGEIAKDLTGQTADQIVTAIDKA
ncbi:host attachment family protein [Caulobacter sp. DWR1-3-2b1]|uniref:host attachment family protein n=1 Tax=Caulobacter sp. DWR1-3-2b1 TaxID=2804670 RepID=UPI003CF2333B